MKSEHGDSQRAENETHGKPGKTPLSKLTSFAVACSVATVVGCSHHGAHQGEHGHHHAFANPERFAAEWNNPKRDEWQKPQEIIAALGLKPGATVADIGAGTGYMVAHLSKAVGERGTVIGVDAEAAMIDYLRAHSSGLGPAKIVPQKVGYDSPELKSETVDAVLTLDTWHHVGGREAYAAKVFAGVKPGGRFVVVDHDFDAETGPPKHMRLKPEQVVQELAAAGFRAEILHETMPRHFMVVGRKP